jgi:hypothetical protein
MRHKIILFITATLLVTSCDNSSDYLSVNEKETESLKIDTASYYKILESNAIEYRNYKRSSVNPILTRAIATNEGNDIVVYSYTNKSSTGYKTYALDKNLKSILGLYPYAYYICEFITATYELTIPGISNRTVRFSDVESPKCGLFPDYTKDEYNLRGYSYTRKGDNITLTTKIIHIKCDQSGLNYDIWFPCRPEELQWIYNIE